MPPLIKHPHILSHPSMVKSLIQHCKLFDMTLIIPIYVGKVIMSFEILNFQKSSISGFKPKNKNKKISVGRMD